MEHDNERRARREPRRHIELRPKTTRIWTELTKVPQTAGALLDWRSDRGPIERRQASDGI
ncbi:hypothetical protein GCM10010994_14310 [Chelatococcus reniformis]|uniref:Uncharacterized protein n=1 Tax=Chelatococcus reniformis TaxID=1494448 RepID=A0A916U402_9HYPH|nr:hypothetical protein GCM10010994_14310 [Chelatococcus reniformis]